MDGFSAVRGSGFRVLADYLVIHNDKAEPRPRRGFSFSGRLRSPPSELAPVSLDTTLSNGTEKEWPS
jgi:hypothetical protein